MKNWAWVRWCVLLIFLIPSVYAQDGYIQDVPHLAYWQVGTQSETVIVLHGGPGVQHACLRPEFDNLEDVAKIIYYDQRGCGKSGQMHYRYTWHDHVNGLKRIITSLSNKNKVSLAGSS